MADFALDSRDGLNALGPGLDESPDLGRGRRFTLALPTIANASVRASQILVIVAVARAFDGEVGAFLLAAVGLLTAFTIAADAGAATFFLARPAHETTRAIYGSAVRWQYLVGFLGSMVAGVLVLVRAPSTTGAIHWAVLAAIAVTQLNEGALRALRAPLLVEVGDARYSFPEFAVAGGKVLIVAAALMHGSGGWLLLLPLPVLAVAGWTFRGVRRILPSRTDPLPERRTGMLLLPYGLAGAASSLYSQAPLVIGTLALPLEQAAMLAVAYRISQPLEILPANMSAQLLPRVRRRMVRRPGRWWAAFVALGGFLALAVVAMSPLAAATLDLSWWSGGVLAVVALALVPKSGNYALVAILVGRGRIGARLAVTLVTGFIALGLSVQVVHLGSPVGFAAVTLAAEVLLAAGLAVALYLLRGEPEARPPRYLLISADRSLPDGSPCNVGDAFLTDVLARALARGAEKVTVADFGAVHGTGAPRVRKRLPGVIGLARAMRSCDSVVVGGGTLFQDDASAPYAGLPRLVLAVSMLGWLLRRPVSFYGVGCDPLPRLLPRLMLRVAVWGRSVWAREESSLARCRQLLGAGRADLGADACLLIEGPDRPREGGVEGEYVVLALNAREAAALTVEDIEALRARHGRVVFVAMDQRPDVGDAQAVPRIGDLEFLPAQVDWREVMAVVRGSSAVVASRMHALYFGMLTGRPVAAVGSSPKVAAFCQEFGVASGPSVRSVSGLCVAARPGVLAEAVARAQGSLRAVRMELGNPS